MKITVTVCNVLGSDDPCLLSVIIGSGSAKLTRWYYNTVTQACASFVYSGMGGNGNNFRSLSECQSRCNPGKTWSGLWKLLSIKLSIYNFSCKSLLSWYNTVYGWDRQTAAVQQYCYRIWFYIVSQWILLSRWCRSIYNSLLSTSRWISLLWKILFFFTDHICRKSLRLAAKHWNRYCNPTKMVFWSVRRTLSNVYVHWQWWQCKQFHDWTRVSQKMWFRYHRPPLLIDLNFLKWFM